MKDQKLWKRYTRLLDAMYKEYTGRITLHKKNEKLPIRKGVGQEDNTSLILFIAYVWRWYSGSLTARAQDEV